MKIATEGYPFIGFFAVVTFLAFLIPAAWAPVLPLALTLFVLYFFRDPERNVPEGRNLFVSPADGRIIVVRDVHETRYIGSFVKQVSIFMSPLDVHVNRSPCYGKVKAVKHNRGGFLAAYKDEASIKNENIEMVLDTEFGDILVRQVAGFVARRAVCRKKEGDKLALGERYGIIKFGSRLDLYLPRETDLKIKIGDRVKAGETIIGELQDMMRKKEEGA